MSRYHWSNLNTQQVGAYTEYFVKMELTMHGFQVYSTEVDDRGVDFVARRDRGPFIEVQVKSLRSMGYVFMRKSKLIPDEHTYVALGLLFEGEAPDLYLLPSTLWRSPNRVFVSRDYEGFETKPEWGINVSQRNMPALQPYVFERTVESLLQEASS